MRLAEAAVDVALEVVVEGGAAVAGVSKLLLRHRLREIMSFGMELHV